MKKLLTTMSAVAVAFGLYATTLSSPTGTSFERPTSGSAGPYDITDNGAPAVNGGEQVRLDAGETYWATNATSTLTLVAGTSISGEGDVARPTVYTTADQDYYLDIKTTLGNPVSRFVNADTSAVDIGTGLYFDSFVKFTAFDDDPLVVTNGEKLAIWLKEVYGNGDSADPTGTNLMITAGWLGVGVTNYSCTVANTSFGDGGWHRVTVKMIDNIYPAAETPVPAFVVFIDGVYAQCTGEDKGIVSGNVNPKYAANVSEGALFPSALQGAAAATAGTLGTVKAVDFDGQGSVDDIVFTTAVPDDWAKDTEFFTIAFDSTKVDYVDWELNGSAAPRIYATTNVVYASGAYFRLTGVEFKQGFMLDDITGITFDSSTGLYNPTADSTLTIAAKSAGATVNGVAYETATAAFAAITAGTAGAGPFTVALNAAATSGVELDNASAVVILDLAGNNITAGALDAAAITLTDGTLLVTNSTETIGQVNGYNGGNAVVTAGGALTIAGGIYNGAVDVSGATSLITGGSFSVNDNKDPDSETVPPAPNSDLAAAAAAAGNELVVGSGSASYYVVQEKAPTAWADLLGDPVDGAYTIDDTADLLALQRGVLLGFATSNVTFKQTANIDMTGVEGFWGIGWFTSSDAKDASITASGNIKFEGVYDGNNKTLSNVTIVRHNYAGIFNCIENATIRDLTVSNVTFSGTCSEEGFAVVGNAYTGCTIANVTSAGTWPAEMRHNAAGIVVRAQGNTTISGCVNNVALSTTSKRLGGILAFAGTAGTVSIQNCTNNATVVSTDGTRGVGGILASPEAGAGETAVVISGCADFGSETAGSSGYTGAIVGALWSSTHTYTDDGGNTFPAASDVCGYFNGKTVHGLAYAVDAGIDGFNYLTTVKASDLAAGNTYTLLANVAPTFALAAAGDTIAFDTARGYTLDGSGITFASGTVTASTSGTVTTYTAALATYTIAYMYGETALTGLTPTTYTIADAVTLPTEVNLGVTGVAFESWTNAEGTVVSNWVAGAMTGNQTFYAKTYVPGPAYPTYLEGATETVKNQYSTWAGTYAPDTESVYEADFLLNVAPGTVGATLSATAISISGTTVTINLNRGNLNGVPYVKKAATVAGLASAPKTAIAITPADNIENGGYFTLTGEDGTAQFYQIGVQSTPLNQN